MPYDSATGSSGPAHQACEYGLPIVSADIQDFLTMAADEDMAISFYKRGDALDLANKLIAILESPERQRRIAQHNFSAAVRMTMPAVLRQYLRWFELAKRKQAAGSSADFLSFRRWRRSVSRSPAFAVPIGSSSYWSLQADRLLNGHSADDSPLGGMGGTGNGRVAPEFGSTK